MAQRSRRNIASSVRGLTRSRRANKSDPHSEPAPENSAPEKSASESSASGKSAPENAAPAAPEGEAAESSAPAGPEPPAEADATAAGDAGVDTAADGGAADGGSADGGAADGASGNGATKRGQQSRAKKGPAKKVLATTSAAKSVARKSGANSKNAANGKAGANGKATTNGKNAANGKATANGEPAGFADNTPTTELPAVTAGEAPAKAIPEAAVGRMAVYLRVLSSMQEQGTATVASEELSAAAGVNSAKLRKDLSYIGSYGTRGVGYEVAVLIGQIERTLGLNQQQRVAVAGIGNLGHALANYGGFPGRGFPVEALFDIDPDLIGVPVGGLPVSHLDDIPEVCAEREIAIGVIATPPTAAQTVCDRLVAGGVQCILNFAPVVLQVPEHIEVRKVDLAVEMQILSFHVARRADGQVNGRAAGAEATGTRSAVMPS